jgi:hypothetical protein
MLHLLPPHAPDSLLQVVKHDLTVDPHLFAKQFVRYFNKFRASSSTTGLANSSNVTL